MAERSPQSCGPALVAAPEALVNPSSEFGLGFLSGGGILSATAKLVMDSVGADGIAIAYATDGTVVCRASCGENAPPVGTPVNLNSGIGAQCLRDGKTVSCADTETDPRVNTAVCRQIGVRSMLAVPLRRGSKVLGVAQVFYAQPNGFSAASVAELESSAGLFVSCLPAANDVEENTSSPVISQEDLMAEEAADSTSGAADQRSLAKLGVDKADVTPSPVLQAPSLRDAVEQISDKGSQRAAAAERPLSNPDKESVSSPPQQTRASAKRVPQPLTGLNARSSIHAGETAPAIFAQIEEPPWWKRPTLVAVALAVMCALLWIGVDKSSRSLLSAKGTQSQNVVEESQVEGNGSTSTSFAQLLKLARSGDAQAQIALAQRYEKGNGVGKNLTKAYSWYIVAAEAGNDSAKQAFRSLTAKLAPAQLAGVRFEVGRMYANGIGVRHRDYVAAYAWLILAEAAGDSRAKAEQKVLARSMRNQEILQARSRAAGWLKARGYRTELAKATPTNAQR